MKNFRKVLALVLVVATLLSFATMASAVEYVDQADINYEAAVDVLSAIGILNGYKTGDEYTFKPGDDIEREEAAKMIAVLSNAGTDVGDLYASACTFADAKDSWAASYIAYCAQTGIIAGHNANTFAPNDSITGYQLAKMLLVTLGFNPEYQGYVGTNWKVNVLRDAKNFGLLDGFNAAYNIAAAITREEAALMMFNTLKAPLVIGTVSENIVTISNALYFDAEVDFVKPTLTLTDALKNGWVLVYDNVIIAGDTPLASIYKGLRVETENVYDCFGRPGVIWSYSNQKGKVLFEKFYADAADYSFTNSVKFEEVLAEEAESFKTYTFTFWVDGMDETVYAEDLATKNTETGKGVVTEIFVDDIDRTVDVVIINTYIAQVDTVLPYAGTFTIDGEDFTNNGFAADDYILFHKGNGALHDDDYNTLNAIDGEYVMHDAKVVKPETVTISDTFYSVDGITKSTFTADGKVYEYARTFDVITNQTPDEDQGTVTEDRTTEKVDVYLDDNGFVMLWKDYTASVEKFVGYFVENTMVRTYPTQSEFEGTANGYGWNDNDFTTVDMVDFTNTKSNVKIADDIVANLGYTWNGAYAGRLAQYKIVGDEATHVEFSTFLPTTAVLEITSGKIWEKEDDITNGADPVLWGNNDTKYMIRTFDYATGDYNYEVVTGHRALQNTYYAKLWANNEKTNEYVEVRTAQYLDLNDDLIADYIFLDAAFAKGSDMFFLVKKLGSGSCDFMLPDNFKAQVPAFDVYSAIVDGEMTTILLTSVDGAKTFDMGLYTASVIALGVTDHDGNPVYAAFDDIDYLKPNPADVDNIYGGQLKIKIADGKFAYENIADDANITLFFDHSNGDIDIDKDGKKDTYVTYKGAESYNKSLFNATEFDCVNIWWTPASGVADITDLIMVVSLDASQA